MGEERTITVKTECDRDGCNTKPHIETVPFTRSGDVTKAIMDANKKNGYKSTSFCGKTYYLCPACLKVIADAIKKELANE